MSQENVEVVRRMYKAFHTGDAEGALACFAPDVVADASRRVDSGIGHGREELSEIVTKWIGTFDDWREEIDEIRDLGTQVVVMATQFGRGKGSGAEVEVSYAVLYEVEDELITSMTIYWAAEEALEAAGLSE